MMTCEELNSVWTLKKRIEREHRRLDDLSVLAESTTPILDGMPHAKPIDFKVERLAAMIADCRDLIGALCQQLVQVKFDLLTRLQSFHLPELQERVLSYHYVSCLKFRDIAKRLDYSNDYVAKLHVRGLQSLGLSLEGMNQIKKEK